MTQAPGDTGEDREARYIIWVLPEGYPACGSSRVRSFPLYKVFFQVAKWLSEMADSLTKSGSGDASVGSLKVAS